MIAYQVQANPSAGMIRLVPEFVHKTERGKSGSRRWSISGHGQR
jgi:hypothetical protein